MVDPAVDKSDWIEFKAGSTNIALHKSSGTKGKSGALKIVFYSSNVAKDRAALLRKKVNMGSVITFGKLQMCDGSDPAGNRIQISNRK